MNLKSKLIRTIYLYLAALLSLIFLAVGTGRLVNTALKNFVFPRAEKAGYSRCNQQPPVYTLAAPKDATSDQKQQLEEMQKAFEQWKSESQGEECYRTEREGQYVDAFTMVMIALPIFLFHWRIIKKEKHENE